MNSKRVILYIDPDPDTFASGTTFVRGHARSVIASREAQAALRILSMEQVNLVVLSDGFPRYARTALVREMKTIKPEVLIVLLAKDQNEALLSGSDYRG